MNSARPWNRHTVPLRPGGVAHRAKRNETPSGVFKVPVTTSSGAGLAGIETSVMTFGAFAGKVNPVRKCAAVLFPAKTAPGKPHVRGRRVCRPYISTSTPLNALFSTMAGCAHNDRAAEGLDSLAKDGPASHILPVQAPQRLAWTGNRSGHSADQSASRSRGGYAMRPFNLAPLYRSTVGFD